MFTALMVMIQHIFANIVFANWMWIFAFVVNLYIIHSLYTTIECVYFTYISCAVHAVCTQTLHYIKITVFFSLANIKWMLSIILKTVGEFCSVILQRFIMKLTFYMHCILVSSTSIVENWKIPKAKEREGERKEVQK